MKLKTTNKAIKEHYNKILSIGYCEAYYLLKPLEPFGYTCGVYGWNADFYEIQGACISTGCRPIGKSVAYSRVREFEKQARGLWFESKDYKQTCLEVLELLKQFVKEETKNE